VLRRVRIYVHIIAIHGCANAWKRTVEVLVCIQFDELALGDSDFKSEDVEGLHRRVRHGGEMGPQDVCRKRH